jgi:fluoroacetyl-CoA thioesterase
MKESLKPGIRYHHEFTLGDNKMVPALYPEAGEFQLMPQVFATGFMVGFLEWACLLAVIPHLDWPREQTVGVHVDFSHEAATPSGLTVVADVELVKVDGRRLTFKAEAHDGIELIARGNHERFVIDKERFDEAVAAKLRAD